jgi:hypothetical protein
MRTQKTKHKQSGLKYSPPCKAVDRNGLNQNSEIDSHPSVCDIQMPASPRLSARVSSRIAGAIRVRQGLRLLYESGH